MSDTSTDFDVVVIGAGFAGMYMLHKLREQELRVRVYETGDDVGGTWYWNRYPGARCDIESLEYSYQFDESLQQEWSWSERYSPQPEILGYAQHVAERFDLKRDIQFETRVTSATFDETGGCWQVQTDRGDDVRARFVIAATGCLSVPIEPEIAGKDDYAGPVYHTGRWPKEGVDFSGQRVAVIGTGSSGIQSIPIIADQARSLTVFQRTPNHSVPAGNAPMDRELEARVKANYAAFRMANAGETGGFGARWPAIHASAHLASEEEREAQFERYWEIGGLIFGRAYGDIGLDLSANEYAAEFIRNKVRSIVDDPETAEKLCAYSAVTCKRLCADTGYFETYNREHVRLVDLRETPIETITASGIRTTREEFEFDAIVFATGFDAMTGALNRIDIRGRGGQSLKEAWEMGPRAYLGLQIVNFPNLFTITGPGSPSVLSNMLPSIEQHVRFVAATIEHVRATGASTIEPEPEAQDAWVDHVNEVGDLTVYPSCNSWYVGANVPGKARVFMPYIGFPEYCRRCDEIVANDYEGFRLSAA